MTNQNRRKKHYWVKGTLYWFNIKESQENSTTITDTRKLWYIWNHLVHTKWNTLNTLCRMHNKCVTQIKYCQILNRRTCLLDFKNMLSRRIRLELCFKYIYVNYIFICNVNCRLQPSIQRNNANGYFKTDSCR